VLLLVPENFLAGKPWSTGIPSETEQREALRRSYSFKRGDYTFLSLSKEIIRATGKRVEWINHDLSAIEVLSESRGSLLSLPPPSIATEEDRTSLALRCSVQLGTVLEHLVCSCSREGLATD
jgi:hypothetical protein